MFYISLFSKHIAIESGQTKNYYHKIKDVGTFEGLPNNIVDGVNIEKMRWWSSGGDFNFIRTKNEFSYEEILVADTIEYTVENLRLKLITLTPGSFYTIPDPTKEMENLYKMCWRV